MAQVLSLSLYTPAELGKQLGERATRLRLQQNWRRATLAQRSGVSAASIKRFETSGQISLDHLLKLALALGCLDQFERLMEPPPATSIDELAGQATSPPRRRGTR